MGISKTSDHIEIKIEMPNPSEEPPASCKAQNEDLEDMDAICTFKIKIASQISNHGYMKDQWSYPNQDNIPNPSQEQPVSQKPELKTEDMDVLYTFKIKIKSQNLELWSMEVQ